MLMLLLLLLLLLHWHLVLLLLLLHGLLLLRLGKCSVNYHVAIFVFDPHSAVGILGLLPAIRINDLHRAVGVPPLLVVGRVNLLLPVWVINCTFAVSSQPLDRTVRENCLFLAVCINKL